MRIKLLFAIISLIISVEIYYYYFSFEKSDQRIIKLIEHNSIERQPGRIEPMPNVIVVERYEFDDWDNDIFTSLENRIKIQCMNKKDCLPKIGKAKSVKINNNTKSIK